MNKLAYCLVALTIISPISEVIGEEPSPSSLQEITECTEQIKERTAALQMRDWPQVDRITRRFIQSCSGVSNRRDIASAYGDVAFANFEMGQFDEALAQANAGIATQYLEPSSHLEKVKALLALNKTTEAKEGFKVADHVFHLAIERNNAKLQTARFDFERESHLVDSDLYKSKLYFLKSELKLLESELKYLESKLKTLDIYRPLLEKK